MSSTRSPFGSISIVGPPGSGKSTVSRLLAEKLAFPEPPVIPMDGFHLSNAELDRLGMRESKGSPETFDAAGYVHILRRVRTGDHTVYSPDFDRDIDEPVAASIAISREADLVLTEGNYLLLDKPNWREVSGHLDLVCFVDTPESVRHERLVARHLRRGLSEVEATRWAATVDGANAKLVEADRAFADLIVDGAGE